MAYIPPHMRKSKGVQSPTAVMLVPRFQKNLNLGSKPSMDKSGKIVCADTAIWRWFAVGLDGNETEGPPPVLLQRVPVEVIERINGEKPLALVRSSRLSEGQRTLDSSDKPWTYLIEKILPDLISSSKFMRGQMEAEGWNSKDVKPKLVARVGKILFIPRRPSNWEEDLNKDSINEATLKQLKRFFYTNIPASYMKGIVDEVFLQIGVKFEDLKDVYSVKLSDKSRPEATISCKCRVMKEENRLELYKVELNKIRHMVHDISCIEKNLDLRLMLSTKQTLTSLRDDEEESIKALIASVILDPTSKGGLRWPFGKASSPGDRYRVIGVCHTVSRIYVSPLMRLKVRDVDWFDFKTSVGETKEEITLMLKGIASELLGKKLDINSVSDMLRNVLKLLWEHFLHVQAVHNGNTAAVDIPMFS
ncbi:uncharacterized protein LOC116192409 isoform X1 [Punica granatum]|uniref:Uncharacterized protein LOC116192409 isoform X1 n=2 Tax=Punica granatum TaxID=22663 RepID=A0A6P8C668_PUNGR|nr:uncharacterized protein LOC116192409 isoform X1 [Punica granatum]